jgi:hypothetical protein
MKSKSIWKLRSPCGIGEVVSPRAGLGKFIHLLDDCNRQLLCPLLEHFLVHVRLLYLQLRKSRKFNNTINQS